MKTMLRRTGAGVALAGTLALGGFAVADAQSSTTTPGAQSGTSAPGTAKPDRTARMRTALAPLVANGTLTQAQADAVVSALAAQTPEPGSGLGGGGRGFRGGRHGGGPGGDIADAATAIGVSPADLMAALKSGQTIAQVATAKGVSVQTVINAMVAAEQQEHPNVAAADITAQVTAQVNQTWTGRGRGRGGPAPTSPGVAQPSSVPGSSTQPTTPI